MKKQKGLTRRSFLQKGSMATVLGAAGIIGLAEKVSAGPWAGTYAMVIDLTRCDGCKGEAAPKCVLTCREENKKKFPVPQKPIKDLWPQKKHEDWSDKKEIIDRLTPYNWTIVQRVVVEGEEVFIPRHCMHCDNPPCAHLCPFGALNKNNNGAVVINPNLCMGGAKCREVCPWHIPQRQSGVGLYLKIQPVPAGGGVMYKCDFCHDRLERGLIPACVEACRQRLGEKAPLFFGRRDEMVKKAHSRAKEIAGFIYGEKENGGTSTFYVSKIPFTQINAELKAAKSTLLMGKVQNALEGVNQWFKWFLYAPILSIAGAIGLAFYQKSKEKKEGEK